MEGRPLSSFYKTFNKYAAAFEKAVTTFMMGAILFVGTTQVIMRYIFNNSLSWSEELMRYIFIWMIFVGAAVTFRNNAHITIDFFTSLMPKKVRKVVFYIAKALVIITLLVLIPAGIDLAVRSIESLSGALQLSRFWVYLSVPVGSLFMINAIVSCLLSQPYQDEALQHHILDELDAEIITPNEMTQNAGSDGDK
jgi:TRAP-type C4-dicarboxylate transport system permease small subunit